MINKNNSSSNFPTKTDVNLLSNYANPANIDLKLKNVAHARQLLSYKFLGNSNGLPTNVTGLSISTAAIIKLLSAFFKSIYCLISRPKFINTPDKIIIEIFYYITIPDHNVFRWYNFLYMTKRTSRRAAIRVYKKKLKYRRKKSIKAILLKNIFIKNTLVKLNNVNIASLYFNKFNILFKLLQSSANFFAKFNVSNNVKLVRPIEFNLIRLHKSDYESNILAQLFILILKKKNIRIAINKLFTKNNNLVPAHNNIVKVGIPAYLAGLYIQIGGRLMREAIIPRLTTKKFEKGAIASGKVNLLDTATITKKNKRGAFTIKVTSSHNFVPLD